MSVQTMRYVSAVPTRQAKGLVHQVYGQIRDDFFKNGSLTSRSKVPPLMAAIWTAGREAMLVEDKVDRTTKDAICAVLSQINDCPYCEDMLVSLVHASGEHDAAGDIFSQNELDATDEDLRKRLEWVRAIATPGCAEVPPTPFTQEQLPEVLGTLMAMSDINRFSHVVMEDSPVSAPFGLKTIKAYALRLFGAELVATRQLELEHGRAVSLLPKAKLPDDMAWANANPRVADALARYTATVEREAASIIDPRVREVVASSLDSWQGEQMPLMPTWVDDEVVGLEGDNRTIASFAIQLAKAPYRVGDKLAEQVLEIAGNEETFVRILAWASFTGSRRFAQILADKTEPSTETGDRQQPNISSPPVAISVV
jgi:AhpD family alkylhydroperoxidase